MTSEQKIEWSLTPRGFVLGEFSDRYNATASIQESSLADEPCIWVGVGPERAHLTQAMAAELLVPLNYFVATGKLPEGHPVAAEVAA